MNYYKTEKKEYHKKVNKVNKILGEPLSQKKSLKGIGVKDLPTGVKYESNIQEAGPSVRRAIKGKGK